MNEKMLPKSYAWSLWLGSALTLLVAVVNVGHISSSSPIWFGLAFVVAAVAQFLTSFVSREWLYVYVVVYVLLAVAFGFFCGISIVLSLPGR